MLTRATFLILGMLLMLSVADAQVPVRNCATASNEHVLLSTDPAYAARRALIEAQTQQYIASNPSEDGATITIPVVVHVVWNTAAENVSDAQIQSQLAVLNEDFRRLNVDAVNTVAQFQGVAADSEIQFCLATRDPSGNAHSGINRVQTSVTSFSYFSGSAVKYTAQGGSDAWPPSSYLNMWVCDLNGGILGIATMPGGPPAEDGIVINYQFFGRYGTAAAPYHLGRTATHEVGHWLNLIHIWGDGGCGIDDLVADTPDDDAANYGCQLTAPACSGIAMVQNYMDYSDDACMNLFTQGQRMRMRALFATGGARAALLTSNGCGPPAPTVSACTPNSGTQLGGTLVTLTGTGFTTSATTTVEFGGITAEAVSVASPSMLTCITPAHSPGAVAVKVVNSHGSGTLTNGFMYDYPAGTPTISMLSLSSGSISGGSIIVATGVGYNASTRFRFGTTYALAVLPLSANQAIIVSPSAATPGTVNVTVENGAANSTLTSGFTFTDGGQGTFWSDNFDTGSPGWTTGATLGTNQWALGSLSGTSTTDPITAHSGTGVRGTVLSGNGNYGNNRNMWLQTPAINCSGKTGIHLNYWRKLTVEDGLYDQARIKVSTNGTTWTQVFANEVGTGIAHHLDPTWMLHDIDLSTYANNQATVYIRWELITDVIEVFGGWTLDDVTLTYTMPTPAMGTASLTLNTTGIGDLQIVVSAAGHAGALCLNFFSLNTSASVNTGSFFGITPDANTQSILGLPLGADPCVIILDSVGSYTWGALGVSMGLPPGFAIDMTSVIIGGPGIAAKSPAVRTIF